LISEENESRIYQIFGEVFFNLFTAFSNIIGFVSSNLYTHQLAQRTGLVTEWV